MELERRRIATQATKDAFKGAVFDWSDQTCAHLLHAHLTNMGHEPPDIPPFDSAASALRALRSLGWNNLTDMLNDMLEPIPAARMILGDVGVVPGDGMEAIFICAGPLKYLGWLDGHDALVLLDMSPGQLTGAWRV